MNKTIWHTPAEGNFDQVIVIDRIVHLSKTIGGGYTIITLDNGEKVLSKDSMKTLDARINSAGRAS